MKYLKLQTYLGSHTDFISNFVQRYILWTIFFYYYKIKDNPTLLINVKRIRCTSPKRGLLSRNWRLSFHEVLIRRIYFTSVSKLAITKVICGIFQIFFILMSQCQSEVVALYVETPAAMVAMSNSSVCASFSFLYYLCSVHLKRNVTQKVFHLA